MNILINSLIFLNLNNNPLFSNSYKYNILNSKFLKQFNIIFLNFLKLKMKNLKFYFILNSVIYKNNYNTYFNGYYNTNFYYESNIQKIEIFESVFENCFTNINKGGGALCLDNCNLINLIIEKTIFSKCLSLNSNSYGGAIYFNEGLIFLSNKNCFFGNYANFGHHIYIQTIKNGYISNNQTTFLLSSIKNPFLGEYSTYFLSFKHIIFDNNFTLNKIYGLGSGLIIYCIKDVILSRNCFLNNSGLSTLSFFNSPDIPSIQYISLINNINFNGVLTISGNYIFCYFIFNNPLSENEIYLFYGNYQIINCLLIKNLIN